MNHKFRDKWNNLWLKRFTELIPYEVSEKHYRICWNFVFPNGAGVAHVVHFTNWLAEENSP